MATSSNQTLTISIFPILLVNFIGILGYSIVIPILIFIVIDLGGNGFIYGILGAMYPLFQFFGAPILGNLSDRIGRKKVLLLSQMGTFKAWLLFLLAFALPQIALWSVDNTFIGKFTLTIPLLLLFVARMFDGFTGGIYPWLTHIFQTYPLTRIATEILAKWEPQPVQALCLARQ